MIGHLELMEEQVDNRLTQLDVFLDEAFAIRVHDPKRSVELAEAALEEARKLNAKAQIAKSLSHLALFYMILGKNQKSMDFAEEAIEFYTELGDERGVADAKYSIAGTLYKTDSYNLGLIYLQDCLQIYQAHNDFYNTARVLKAMGTIYEYFGDEKGAIKAYKESMEFGHRANETNMVSNAMNPLSGIYLNRGEIDLALEMIENAIIMKEVSGDKRGIAFSLYGRGKVFTKMKRFAEAERDLLDSINIHTETGERLGETMSYRKLGELYLEMGETRKALEVLNKGLDICKKHNLGLVRIHIYHVLYQVMKYDGNINEALKFLELFSEDREQLTKSRNAKIIESFEMLSRMEILEKEANQAREKAEIIESKNLELDSFFYRVSHDLKGPITSLISLDYLARLEIEDPKVVEWFDKYLKQVYHINHILDELMKIAKMTHGSHAKRLIDFEELISACIASYQHLANFEKVEFETSVTPGIQYESQWALVNTIIQNLVENGIKYARVDQERPLVKLSVTPDENQIVIVVEDNGIGMREEEGRSVFEKFYRAHKKVEGTGLGLYILQRAVETLGGQIDLESEVNSGSKFTIWLPINV
jgi:signal transduction histidine kinase